MTSRNDIRNFANILRALNDGAIVTIGDDFRAEKHGRGWGVSCRARGTSRWDCGTTFNHAAMARAILLADGDYHIA